MSKVRKLKSKRGGSRSGGKAPRILDTSRKMQVSREEYAAAHKAKSPRAKTLDRKKTTRKVVKGEKVTLSPRTKIKTPEQKKEYIQKRSSSIDWEGVDTRQSSTLQELLQKEKQQLLATRKAKKRLAPSDHPVSSGKHIQLGERLYYRWTNNSRQYQAIVEVEKINSKSLRIKIIEALDDFTNESYKPGRSWSKSFSNQTANNGMFKITNQEYHEAIDKNRVHVKLSETSYDDRQLIRQFGLNWDRSSKSWRGTVDPADLDQLEKFGTVSLDGKFTSAERQESLELGVKNRIKKTKARIDRLKSEKKNIDDWLDNSSESRFLALGEPIKVGHHSEKKHRKAIERFDKKWTKSIELGHTIDAEEERLSRLETELERMKD